MSSRRIAYVQWKVTLDPTLAARVESANWDPVSRKPRYGSRKQLLESLLREWLERQEGASPNANPL